MGRTDILRSRLLATAAEFRVIDLVAQHDPEPNAELTRRGDLGFPDALLSQLSTLESLQRQISTNCRDGGLTPQKSQERSALLRQRPQPLPCAARVFARNQPDVARKAFRICKSRGIAEEHVGS